MRKTSDEAYKAGYSAGLNGPGTDNCHFSFFATPDLTKSWERGNALGRETRDLVSMMKQSA